MSDAPRGGINPCPRCRLGRESLEAPCPTCGWSPSHRVVVPAARPSLGWLLRLHVISLVGIFVLLWIASRIVGPGNPLFLFSSITRGQLLLTGVWLVLGPGQLRWRLTVFGVLFGIQTLHIGFVWIGAGGLRNSPIVPIWLISFMVLGQMSSHVQGILAALTCVMAGGPLRLAGEAHTIVPGNSFRFSIWHLVLLTTFAAVIAALLGYAVRNAPEPPRGSAWLLGVIPLYGYRLVMLIAAIWAALRAERFALWSIAVVVVDALCVTAALGFAFRQPFGFAALGALVQSATVAGTLCVIRRAGYRMRFGLRERSS